MQTLFGRNNIICKSYVDKNIYIYEDHRTILNILQTVKEAGIFSIPSTLICFDKHDDFLKPVWELLGWRHSEKGFYFDSKSRKAKLVLDFDLDCFSDELHGYTVAWREEILFNLFNKPFDKYDYTPKDFLVSLFKESSFTTIAKESECFSYINESDTVFKCLNEILFNNRL